MPSVVKLTLESNQYEKGMRQAQKSWNDFTKGIGLSMSKFTAVGAAIGAVTGALKVAKDAFFKNEQQLDDWSRVVESSKSIYNGFLNSINNGDISGFLSNINTITEAAKAAYNAMDELATFNAFNQINIQKSRTGMTEAIAGYRMGNTSKEQVQASAEAYKKELQARLEKEQENYNQAVRKAAAQRGVPWGNLLQVLEGSYENYQKKKEVQPTGERMVTRGGGMFTSTSYIEKYAVNSEEKMGEALRSLNDTELDHLQSLGAQAQRTSEEIAQIDKQMARVLNGKSKGETSGGKTGGGKTGGIFSGTKVEQTELQKNQAQINTLTQEYVTLGDVATQQAIARKEAIQGEIHALTQRNNQLKLYAEQAQGKFQGGHVMMSNLGGGSQWNPEFADKPFLDIGEGLSEDVMAKVNLLAKSGNNAAEAWKHAGTAIGLFGSAISAIKDPAAQVAATVAQAIATVALAYSQSLAEDQGTKSNVWAFIAAAAAATISMVTTIASIHSATGYAHGGIVDGNSFSGDNVPIMANAGELVLTKSMQSNLANHLEGTGLQGLGPSSVSGEQIYVVLNRYTRRSGKGELVTW